MIKFAIRKANYLDVSNILVLFNKYLVESNLSFYPECNDQASVWISDLIKNHMMFVAETIEKKIVGMLGFRCGPFFYNDKVFNLSSDIFMIDKDYRKSNIAKEMIEEAKRLGDTLKIPVLFGIMSGIDPEMKDRFTKSCGFKYLGGNFIYGDY